MLTRLVVTMQAEERVAIGEPANPTGWVKCVRIRGDKVRMLFEFPRDVPVHRERVVASILAGEPRHGETKG